VTNANIDALAKFSSNPLYRDEWLSVSELTERGSNYFSLDKPTEEDLQRSERSLRVALKEDPSAADANFWLGMVLVVRGQYPEAIKRLQKTADTSTMDNEKRALAFNIIAKNYQYGPKRDSSKAFNAITEELELNPDDELALSNRANFYMEDKNWADAQKDYEKLIKSSDNAHKRTGHLGLADVFFKQKLNKEARSELFQATKLADKDAATWRRAGDLLWWSSDSNARRDAFLYYNQAIKIEPENGEYYSVRGFKLATSGEKMKAQLDFDRAFRLAPKDPNLHMRYAWALFYLYRNEPARALREWNTALALTGSKELSVSVVAGLSVGYWLNGDHSKAIEYYRNLVAKSEIFSNPARLEDFNWLPEQIKVLQEIHDASLATPPAK